MMAFKDRLQTYFSGQMFPDPVASPDLQLLEISLPEEGLSIQSLKEFLAQVLPEYAAAIHLPDSLHALAGLTLTRVAVADSGDPQLAFTLKWDASWSPCSALNFSGPELSVGVIETANVFFELAGVCELGGLPFMTSVQFLTESATTFDFRAELIPGIYPLSDFLAEFQLNSEIFDDVFVSQLELGGSPEQLRFLGSIIGEGSPLGEVDFKLNSIQIDCQYELGQGGGMSGELTAVATLGSSPDAIEIAVDGKHGGPEQGWQISGSVATALTMGDLADKIGKVFGLNDLKDSLPLLITDLTDITFAVSLNTGTKQIAFHFSADFETSSHITFDINLTKTDAGSYDKHFAGKLLRHEREFDLIFDQANKATTFLGVYLNPGGDEIELSDLIGDPAFKSDLSFKVKDVLLAYVKDSPNKYVFSLDMDLGIELSGLGNLPLIGKALSKDSSLTLAFQPIISSKTPPDLTTIKQLAPAGSPHLPDSVKGGFEFVTSLRIGDLIEKIDFGASTKGGKLDQDNINDSSLGSPVVAPSPQTPLAANAVATNPNASWIDLQRHFGPLFFKRIGLGYQNEKIDALLDASISLGPLDVSLLGLGAEYDLKTKELSFSLTGLSIDFEKAPLQIGGAFLRFGDDFAGELLIKTESLSLGAVGAYSNFQHQPSLFIYAFVDYPLGGPSFFFVEGLALGFGLNRQLNIPPVNELYEFPLIADVMGSGPSADALKVGATAAGAITALTDEMGLLESYLVPQLGQYFICAGVRFSTFKQIDSFALFSLSVGKRLEVDVLGISKLKVPTESPEVLAEVDLEFAARVVPEEGYLAAQAELTPQSYVLSQQCHLQGGFAFSSWFTGDHAGDFVYTVGGYHPQFSVPSHYPTVPRVGFNWHISDSTQMKGAMYYALTPTTAMAGGRLEATFQSGSVSAWFTLGADFLISWKPFHYDASAQVEIGAALTVECFGTHHVTISASADLHIWGPEFAGQAHVTVKVLIVHVHFDVEFGNSSASAPPKIGWEEFQKTFLPARDKVIGITATRGLIRTIKDDDGSTRWIVNAKEFCLIVDSAIPLFEPNGKFPVGIEPMGIGKDKFKSELVVKVNGKILSDGSFTPIVKKNVPPALWSPNGTSGLDGNSIPAVTGYSVHPVEPSKPETTHDIRDAALRFEVNPKHVTSPPAVTITYEQSSDLSILKNAPDADLIKQLGFDPLVEISLADTLIEAFIEAPQAVIARI